MSHASVLVAIDSASFNGNGRTRKIVEELVADQMAPFDEDGEWFKDGSRWDWWQIGGRYTGCLSSYDPDADPRNYETCRLCHGTGTRRDMVVANGCNGCHGTGTARKFSNVVYAGDITQRSALDIEQIRQARIAHLEMLYAKARREVDAKTAEFLYDVKADESLDAFKERALPNAEACVTHFAFLRNSHWHESERLGWFGTTTATECERKEDAGQIVKRCLHKDGKTDARIVVWNEPWEIWSANFWKRFVEPLPPETVLVTVDYHV